MRKQAPDRAEAQSAHGIEGRIGIEQTIGPEFVILRRQQTAQPVENRSFRLLAHFTVAPGFRRQRRRLRQVALAEQPDSQRCLARASFRL